MVCVPCELLELHPVLPYFLWPLDLLTFAPQHIILSIETFSCLHESWSAGTVLEYFPHPRVFSD